MAVDVKWKSCLLITTLAASAVGRLDVNVALRRPAYQVSTYVSQWKAYTADHANDGNHNTDLEVSCVHTLNDMYPWWAVDLTVALYVYGIQFVNRNSSPERSDNFVIGLTNVSPTVTAPALTNYPRCGQYPGVVGLGTTVYLKCACNMAAYRYVIVQVPLVGGPLNFCELQVFIRRWEWDHSPGKRMMYKWAYGLSTFTVAARLECMYKCVLHPSCDSYNYRPSDKECELNTHDAPLIAKWSDVANEIAWGWWRPTFCTVQ